jgi:tetratricopeptide (TPR) repeat protein
MLRCFGTVCLVLAALLALQPEGRGDDGDSWVGKRVMMKRSDVKLRLTDENHVERVVGTVRDHVLTVRKSQGSWIAVRSRGVTGWVRKDEAVPLESAISYFTARIDQNDRDDEAYSQRATAWAERGELDIALRDHNEAIRLSPNSAAHFNNRAFVYYRTRDYDRAIPDYDEAIRLDPKRATAFFNRGNVYYRTKDYDRAIHDFGEAIRLDPKYVNAFNNRGVTYRAKKDYDRAIRDFEEAIRLDPEYVNAYNNKAIVLATCADDNLRDVAKAEELMKTVIKLRAASPYNEVTLGVIAAAQGRFEDAMKHQKKALEDPEFAKNEGEKARERLKTYQEQKPYRE